ncbi:hypothetical protein [Bacillus sp. FJAT-49736]|uniref:hypothetical protein n=1 Tax=Bacillus sp. FJAT-49736 TaxID=2833582 RepID=UPI001BC90352|nr:hypothetical protein [Bacillus sp. FJAT-49736]MBS4172705.1 hypothetical protein [Bacillus sp. FJAT-49736]
MKKSYIFLAIIILGSLFAYSVHITNENNHYADYINERLNNLIKPNESDISQADMIIKDAINSKQISTNDVKGLVSLYGDFAANIQELQSIEQYITETSQFGETSKRTLFSIHNKFRSMQFKGKMVKLTDNQMNILQEISKMNQDLLKVLKPTVQQEYKVKEDQWIMVIKKMDIATQKYDDSFWTLVDE